MSKIILTQKVKQMRLYTYCPLCKTALSKGKIDGRKRQYCEKCKWINYVNPVPVVACLVVNRKKEILLVKRGIDPCKGRWALPGGFIEINETPQMAGLRELKEETGLKGSAGSLIDVHLQQSKMYGFVMVVGIEFIIKDEKISTGDDAVDAKFFPKKSFPNVPFISHSDLIAKFLGYGTLASS